MDTQLRPFVFFTSKSELMGHVWSGTASERTTALQVCGVDVELLWIQIFGIFNMKYNI